MSETLLQAWRAISLAIVIRIWSFAALETSVLSLLGVSLGLLDGKVAIVTGAETALGQIEALALGSAGCAVVVCQTAGSGHGDSASNAARSLGDRIVALGGRAVAQSCDPAVGDEARMVIDSALDAFGGLDVLVNNPSLLPEASRADLSEEAFDAHVRSFHKSQALLCFHAGDYWMSGNDPARASATIINAVSEDALCGRAGAVPFAAVNGAIAAITVALGRELATYGVRVNGLAVRGPSSAVPSDVLGAILVWLASDNARVTGRVVVAGTRDVALLKPWREVARTQHVGFASVADVEKNLGHWARAAARSADRG